ncbi:MAG: helix-turn-helix domain-containing protein [Actinobacteria bacterium]|nr:helix-turn-helix domain-containing protein [Actinomycetota bacterium]MBS1883924.1 helix-turn-helix domain-containing protein [Actinomycetota bacterium]
MNRLELGTRLRALRTQRGLSLSQLEVATDISSSFLSLVESGKSDITISRLLRLADFFDVELGDLVEGSRVDRRPLEVIRDGDGSVLASRAEGVTARFLGHQRWALSPRVSEYEPGGTIEVGEGEQTAREMLHHHELFIYVVVGTFEITVHGQEPVRVARGDAVLVRDGADRVVNVGRRRGRVLVVGVATGS